MNSITDYKEEKDVTQNEHHQQQHYSNNYNIAMMKDSSCNNNVPLPTKYEIPKSITLEATSVNDVLKTTSFASLLKNNEFVFNEFNPNKCNNIKKITVKKPENKISNVQDIIKKNEKIMIILRGLPGSGKSYLAKQLVDEVMDNDGSDEFYSRHIFSTDTYFIKQGNRYVFQPNLLNEAHAWNQLAAEKQMKMEHTPIIIDNTNIKTWEMEQYVAYAIMYKYKIEILEPNTEWRYDYKKCSSKTIHGVPELKIFNMKKDFESTTVNELINRVLTNTRIFPGLSSLPIASDLHLQISTQNIYHNFDNTTNNEITDNSNNDYYSDTNNSTNNMLSKPQRKYQQLQQLTSEILSPPPPPLILSQHQHPPLSSQQNQEPAPPPPPPLLLLPLPPPPLPLPHEEREQYIKNFDAIKSTTNEQNSSSPETNFNFKNSSIDWTVYDNESKEFWSINDKIIKVQSTNNNNSNNNNDISTLVQPKPQRSTAHTSRSKYVKYMDNTVAEQECKKSQQIILDMLIEKYPKVSNTTNTNNNVDDADVDNSTFELKKHKKNCPNENIAFANLREILYNTSLVNLWDLFIKCKGDAQWTMDILLHESKSNDGNIINSLEQSNDGNDFVCYCDNSIQTLPNEPSTSGLQQQQQLQKKKKQRKVQQTITTHKSKKQHNQNNNKKRNITSRITNMVKISDDNLSNHVKQLRNIRYGYNNDATNVDNIDNNNDNNNNDSDKSNNNNNTFDFRSRSLSFDSNDQSPLSWPSLSTPSSKSNLPSLQSSTDSEISSTQQKNYVSVDIGFNGICQLSKMFGTDGDLLDESNLKTNVMMPKEYARNLYTLWLRSVAEEEEERQVNSAIAYQSQISIDEQVDYEYELYNYNTQENAVQQSLISNPNINDVIDMQEEWTRFERLNNSWSAEYPEDLSTKLKLDALCEIYPDVTRDTLITIYAQNGKDYDKTISFLQNTNSQEQMCKITEDLCEKVDTEIKKLHESKAELRTNQDVKHPKLNYMYDIDQSNLNNFEQNRNMAKHHNDLRKISIRQLSVANGVCTRRYFKNMKDLYTSKIETYNQWAASQIIQISKDTRGNDQLDLHYLYVPEAIVCLDMFIDHHIAKLKLAPRAYKSLMVITGYGKHSNKKSHHISPIKDSTIKRLTERCLPFSEINPGLLKIRVYPNSVFSTNYK